MPGIALNEGALSRPSSSPDLLCVGRQRRAGDKALRLGSGGELVTEHCVWTAASQRQSTVSGRRRRRASDRALCPDGDRECARCLSWLSQDADGETRRCGGRDLHSISSNSRSPGPRIRTPPSAQRGAPYRHAPPRTPFDASRGHLGEKRHIGEWLSRVRRVAVAHMHPQHGLLLVVRHPPSTQPHSFLSAGHSRGQSTSAHAAVAAKGA